MLAALAYVVLFSPLFISTVVRSYGWLLLLSDHGLVNSMLATPPLHLGPYRLIYNEIGVIIALVHILLPFAVLPLVSVFWLLPANLRECARDLGASPLQAFLKVTLPLSLPGVVSRGTDRVRARGQRLRHAGGARRRPGDGAVLARLRQYRPARLADGRDAGPRSARSWRC